MTPVQARCEVIEREMLEMLDRKTPAEVATWAISKLQWALSELRRRESGTQRAA